MKAWELIGYSRQKIKGRRREAFFICILPLCADLFFRIAEAALYSIMLYLEVINPSELFTGKSIEQLVIAVIFTVSRWLVSAPLYCASALRLREFISESENKTFVSDMLLSWRFIRRSISSFIFSKLISALSLVPAIISGYYLIDLLSSGADSMEIIIASNAAAVFIISLILWCAVQLNLAAVPFLLAEFPEKSGAGAVFLSFKFMRGRRKTVFSLWLIFLLPMLLIVTVPFLISELSSAYAFGISIFLKEDEYSGYQKKHLFSLKKSIRLRRNL